MTHLPVYAKTMFTPETYPFDERRREPRWPARGCRVNLIETRLMVAIYRLCRLIILSYVWRSNKPRLPAELQFRSLPLLYYTRHDITFKRSFASCHCEQAPPPPSRRDTCCEYEQTPPLQRDTSRYRYAWGRVLNDAFIIGNDRTWRHVTFGLLIVCVDIVFPVKLCIIYFCYF